MTKIIFLCHGNICRSPMAEFVMKDLVEKAGISAQFEIASAATSTEEIGNPFALAITFRHPLSLLSQLFQQGGAALQHILPCDFKIPGVPRVCHIAGATGVIHQQ